MNTIRIACQGAGTIPHTDLLPFQGNLKSLSKENYSKLKGEILKRGFSEPISVWKSDGKNYILNGHQRLRTLQTLEKEEGYDIPPIPVNFVDADNIQEAKLKVLSLASQYGQVEGQGLYEFLTDSELDVDQVIDSVHFPEIDLDDFKTEFYEDHTVEPAQCDEDEIPEFVEPKTKPGDIYKLGNHRLMCGDSTMIDQVETLLDGKKPDMIFTDPPYNVAFNGRSGKFDVIKNDDLSDGDFSNFIDDVCQTINMINPEAYYIWCNWKFYGILQDKLPYNACIVWAKNVFGMGNGYRHQHEFCLFKGQIDSEIKNESDLWSIAKDRNYVHPTQKPVELAERALQNHKNHRMILDLFGGSGSTMIACEKNKRFCFTMELDPKYCDVIVARWEKYTGKQAELITR